MKNRWTWVALVAIMFGLATPLAYADDGDDDDGGGGGSAVASLNLENFISQEFSEVGETGTSDVNGTCNPFTTSTFTFEITGVAAGPYPGTFTESGSFTLNAFAAPPDFDNTLASFESTFTITSGATTVEGSKSLVETLPSQGLCGFPAIPSGGPEAVSLFGTMSYSAEITTPTGTGTDSGTAFVNLADFDNPDLVNSHSFTESFTSTAPPGGGDDDDDDDDDGDDDDDDGDDD
jgi:hypothetical protein